MAKLLKLIDGVVVNLDKCNIIKYNGDRIILEYGNNYEYIYYKKEKPTEYEALMKYLEKSKLI